MVHVATGLNNLNTKVGKFDVADLKTIPISDVMSKQIVSDTKFNTLNVKINSLEKKIPDASTLVQTNQWSLEKKMRVWW